ncbi:COG0212 5-formyltetrahydrofolate cyclo-ligase [Mycobacteriaceae bacterium]
MTKARCRAELLAARRAVPQAVRRAEAALLCGHLGDVVGDARTVCAYVPVGTEPGSVEMLERLRELCDAVLLPLARTDADGEHPVLGWAEYVPGELVAATLGLREPARGLLDPATLARADIVLVPALAVDRTGVRLGRGGGFYDRALALCAPGTPLVAVVRDSEVLDSLPAESHDVPMTHALTPTRGMIALPERSGA